MQVLTLKKQLTDEESDALHGKFLTENSYDMLIQSDTDAYNLQGELLFKFRKNAIPYEMALLGYESFKESIEMTEGRGMASGSSHKRIRKDGSRSNITVGNKVLSGNVGFMDAGPIIHYCRRTGFARKYFEKYKSGIDFVKCVDKLYSELAPEYYQRQMKLVNGTNKNYVIKNTCFTTVTVNQNFQTAVHKDAGDYKGGFGNLSVFRKGTYKGSYFCMPQYKVAIDMHTTDILFADVHKWHGNTPFNECSDDYLRIAFVMYYREFMLLCKQPADELLNIKMKETGYYTL